MARFAKLFLSHLAEQFAKQSAPHLRNIVASQVRGCPEIFTVPYNSSDFIKFEGLSVYGTMCHGCGYKSAQKTRFLEIEIALMVRG
jgi:ubiquitin carboxyl-terminal hydrolase 48